MSIPKQEYSPHKTYLNSPSKEINAEFNLLRENLLRKRSLISDFQIDILSSFERLLEAAHYWEKSEGASERMLELICGKEKDNE